MTDTSTEPRPPASSEAPDRPVVGSALAVRRRRTKRRLLFVFVLLVAALVFLLVEGLGSSLDYFDTINQALSHRAQLGTTSFRLEGNVMPGSIHSTAAGADFSMCQGANMVDVVNTGSPPQLFQSNIPVVVVGHFSSDTSRQFLSNTIMVKHSSTYTAQYPGRVHTTATSAC
ncbi:MAG TPA: cytochrome c maturation protein CcmE [Acidimicrobiales bacterium]